MIRVVRVYEVDNIRRLESNGHFEPPSHYFEKKLYLDGSILPEKGREIPARTFSQKSDIFCLEKGTVTHVEGTEKRHIMWVATTTLSENFRRFAQSEGDYTEVGAP